ncbi:MAG: hypothetical protein VKN72_03670 [Nostocales cyanobacterium 94392]|nr:hypothetical protein [Nostocales cyanobacterium 94392]
MNFISDLCDRKVKFFVHIQRQALQIGVYWLESKMRSLLDSELM